MVLFNRNAINILEVLLEWIHARSLPIVFIYLNNSKKNQYCHCLEQRGARGNT